MSKQAHINNLLFQDKTTCDRQLREIADSDLCESTKNILAGFFRTRKELNESILQENGFYNEKNINDNTEEHAN
jgi:hypothetical protein